MSDSDSDCRVRLMLELELEYSLPKSKGANSSISYFSSIASRPRRLACGPAHPVHLVWNVVDVAVQVVALQVPAAVVDPERVAEERQVVPHHDVGVEDGRGHDGRLGDHVPLKMVPGPVPQHVAPANEERLRQVALLLPAQARRVSPAGQQLRLGVLGQAEDLHLNRRLARRDLSQARPCCERPKGVDALPKGLGPGSGEVVRGEECDWAMRRAVGPAHTERLQVAVNVLMPAALTRRCACDPVGKRLLSIVKVSGKRANESIE
eukprot:scaffold32301_cov135-Isochrysis_galbana.AAC.2